MTIFGVGSEVNMMEHQQGSSGSGRLMRIELPVYDAPPQWKPPAERLYHPDYNNDIRQFLPRSVKLRRSKVTDALGFNVRGGKEYLCGIYISKVSANTEAERLGLQEGDQILSVNGMSFEDVEHSKAVKLLKSHTDVEMTVKFFPFGYNKTYDKSRALASIQHQQQQHVEPYPVLQHHQPPQPTYQNYDDFPAPASDQSAQAWHQYHRQFQYPSAHQLAISTSNLDDGAPHSEGFDPTRMGGGMAAQAPPLHVRPIAGNNNPQAAGAAAVDPRYYDRQFSYSLPAAAAAAAVGRHRAASGSGVGGQPTAGEHLSEEQRQRMLRTPNKYV